MLPERTPWNRSVHPADQDLWAEHRRRVLGAEFSDVLTLYLHLVHRDGALRRVRVMIRRSGVVERCGLKPWPSSCLPAPVL
jgi:hypothetical protein